MWNSFCLQASNLAQKLGRRRQAWKKRPSNFIIVFIFVSCEENGHYRVIIVIIVSFQQDSSVLTAARSAGLMQGSSKVGGYRESQVPIDPKQALFFSQKSSPVAK